MKVLAVKAYLRLHKELSFELGEIYQEMARVKLERCVPQGRRAAVGLATPLSSPPPLSPLPSLPPLSSPLVFHGQSRVMPQLVATHTLLLVVRAMKPFLSYQYQL